MTEMEGIDVFEQQRSRHIVLDTSKKPLMMWCKICDERFRFPHARMDIETAIMYLMQFRKAHYELGCTDAEWKKKQLVDKL